MGVDALDDSLFPIVPKVKWCNIDESLEPLVGPITIMCLSPLGKLESSLYMLIQKLVGPSFVFCQSGLLQDCLVDSDEDVDELMCGFLLPCWNDHDLEYDAF